MIFVGVDWAEAHHDVLVQDENSKRLGGGCLPGGVEGIARFHELAGNHVDEPSEVVVGIETDRGLFLPALVAPEPGLRSEPDVDVALYAPGALHAPQVEYPNAPFACLPRPMLIHHLGYLNPYRSFVATQWLDRGRAACSR
jgi:hypothetical protein